MVPRFSRSHGRSVHSRERVGKPFMTPTEKLYRLNGQLERCKRSLGEAYGILSAILGRRHPSVMQLGRVYDDLKRIQDEVYRRYVA